MGCVSSKTGQHTVCIHGGVAIDDSIHVMIQRDLRNSTQSCCYRPREPHPLLQKANIVASEEDEEEGTVVEIDAVSSESNNSLRTHHQ